MSVIYKGGFSIRGGQVNGSLTTGTISGTVVDGSSNPISGCVVQLSSGGTLVGSGTTNGSGVYSISGIFPSSYTLTLHPSLNYCLGVSEPNSYIISVGSGQTVTQNFVVQLALYSTDFQSFSTAQLLAHASPIANGDFFYHNDTAYQIAIDPTGMPITSDATGGPGGSSKAMKYAYPARPASPTSYTIQLGPRIFPPPILTEVWFRWTDKYSLGFEDGGAGQHGALRSYKVFLAQIGVGGSTKELGVYFGGDTSQGQNITFQMNVDAVYAYNGNDIPSANWMGNYHSFVMGSTGLGTANCISTLYMDGLVILTCTGPFFPGGTVGGAGQILFPNLAANINNGPDLAQDRWWREFGMYTKRPSLLNPF